MPSPVMATITLHVKMKPILLLLVCLFCFFTQKANRANAKWIKKTYDNMPTLRGGRATRTQNTAMLVKLYV